MKVCVSARHHDLRPQRRRDKCRAKPGPARRRAPIAVRLFVAGVLCLPAARALSVVDMVLYNDVAACDAAREGPYAAVARFVAGLAVLLCALAIASALFRLARRGKAPVSHPGVARVNVPPGKTPDGPAE